MKSAERRDRWARSRQALLVVYVLQQHSVVLGVTVYTAAAVVLRVIGTKLNIRISAELRSDLRPATSSTAASS